MIEPVEMAAYIRNSNLIENIDDPKEDRRSFRAWNWLVDRPGISMLVLMELHDRITRRQLPKADRGRFRKVGVRVGDHIPPPPEIAKAQATDWLWDLMEQWKTLDPKEMHIRFETIHPFVDGNGRVGRMLMWWHETRLARTPTLISFENRAEYYNWFKETRGAKD